jgi:hypothetical protein
MKNLGEKRHEVGGDFLGRWRGPMWETTDRLTGVWIRGMSLYACIKMSQ